MSMSYLDAETGAAPDGIERCLRALAMPAITPVTEGLIHSQLGLLRMRTGAHAAAVEDLARAIALLEGHPEYLGRAHLNRGTLHLQRGDPEAATADLAQAQARLLEAGLEQSAAKAQHNLGYARLLQGDLVTALRTMDQAAAVLAPLSEVSRATCDQDRAEVLLAAGRTDEAIHALESAAAAYGRERLRRFQAECEYVLARTLLAEDPEGARVVARSAARRFTQHGSESWAIRAEAIAAIAEVESGGTTAALIGHCDDLAGRLREAGYRQDADRLALHAARLAVRRKDLADAAVRISKVRVTTDSPITLRLLAREIRAELSAARAEPGRTRMYARRGLAELHAWQATFGSYDLHSSTVGHGQQLARLGLRAALSDGRPEIVFEWSERARALASRVSSLRPPPDPELAADLAELRATDRADRTRIRALKERIRSHSWFSASGTVGEPIGLAELQDRLEDTTAMLAHIVLEGTITALVVTPDEAQVVPLGESGPVRARLDRVAADLDFAAQHRTGELSLAVRGSLRGDLEALSAALIDPVAEAIGERRLVLTPSALLVGTAWGCLPGLSGRALTLPISATRWSEQIRSPLAPPRVAGFVAGPRLQRAEEEVKRSAEAWPTAQVLTGDQADAARVGWLATRVDLLHLAGHGSHPGDHPLFAAVDLDDGPWFGHDIDLLPRTPEVVLLSACDLGRMTVLHGEESIGMSGAWLHAGARTVISSPALISDDLACEVFAAWHQRVSAGTSPAAALAEVIAAQQEAVPLVCFGAGW